MNLRTALVLALLIACVAGLAPAQTSTGSITGSVLDPNAAVIPGVKVVARHEPTGRDFTTQSTEAGIYIFPTLPVGPYTLTVEHTGFKKLVRSNIEVRIGLRQTLDLNLEIGSVDQQIEVKAEVPLLETTTAERGQNVSPNMLSNLPLFNGSLRNAEAFVSYMPGVNSWGEVSINGSIGRAKEVEIDGASLTIPESGGTVFHFPGFEAYSEFKLITSQFNAEYGRLGGGLEQFATKSGTNQFHALAFLNLKRDVLNAGSWAGNSNRNNPKGYRPKERFNEEGGAAGGPVWIPKVYDGRNKSFFYFTYAKIIQPVQIAVNSGETVPTALMRQGNFSEVATIYDPNTTSGSTRLPFAGNIIPQSRWSKISSNILPYIPAAQSSAVTGNYNYLQSTMIDNYIWTLKLDHSITDNNRVAFFMSRQTELNSSDQYFPGPLSNGLNQFQKPDNYRINHDYVIKPTVLLHTTFGFSRQQQTWDNPLQKGFASKIGLPLSGNADATPIINFQTDNLSAWGMNQGKVANGGQWNWTTHVSQQAIWTRGKHIFKMGWDIRRLRTSGDDWAGTNGFYYFNRAQTALPTALTSTGNAFASFLLGAVNNANATATPVTGGQARYGYHAGFFQDTYRVTPRLTLDYGIRYEVPIGWHDVNGNYSSLDMSKPNPGANNIAGALIFAGTGAGRTGDKRLYPTDFSDIGPRAGFAYRLGDKTVLRGGFGIYYQTLGNGGCGCTAGINGSYEQRSNGIDQAFNWDQGGVQPPPGFQAPPRIDPSYANFGTILRLGPNYGKAPRIYNWSFTIQHELKNWLFEAAYVGNRGHGLNSGIYLNQLPVSNLQLGSLLTKSITDPSVDSSKYKVPFDGFVEGWKGGATVSQALRLFPQYGTVYDANAGVGKTWYDSLQTKVERRFGSLNFMASYVWSKSLAKMTYRQIFSQGSNVQAQDQFNLDDAKGLAYMDIPHFVNILYSYDLPFGRGKKFFSGIGRGLDAVIGGWTIAGTGQYRSGGLIQIITPGNPLGSQIGSPVTKANYTGGKIRTGVSSGDLDPNNADVRWLAYNSTTKGSDAFTSAPAYTLGTTAMYHPEFRNPWFRTENFSITKNWTIWESVRFRYRADIFNPFNRTAFGSVNGTINNVNFGRVQGAQVGARVITMGIRAEF